MTKIFSILKTPLSLLLMLLPCRASANDPPFSLPPAQEVERLKSAVIFTDKGRLFLELFPDQAPWHVANFKFRADKGLYRNRPFTVFEPGYIIQGGGLPSSKEAPYSIPAEFNEHLHERGAVGMARFDDQINRERSSAGGEFYIILGEAGHMDRHYTVFGRVVSGFDVLDRLRKGSVIKEIKVYVRQPEAQTGRAAAIDPATPDRKPDPALPDF